MKTILAFLWLCSAAWGVDHWTELAWNASTGADGYNVYRANVHGGPYTQINTGLIQGLSYADHGIVGPAGTLNCYVATAVNAIGESGYSAEVCGIYPADSVTPIDTTGPPAFPSTSLAAPIGTGDRDIPVPTAKGLVPFAADLKSSTFGVLIDREYMTITVPPSMAELTGDAAVWLHVFRGAFGGYGVPHISGSTVWYGPARYFQTRRPRGACDPTTAVVLPWVEIYHGEVYDCANGRWVKR